MGSLASPFATESSQWAWTKATGALLTRYRGKRIPSHSPCFLGLATMQLKSSVWLQAHPSEDFSTLLSAPRTVPGASQPFLQAGHQTCMRTKSDEGKSVLHTQVNHRKWVPNRDIGSLPGLWTEQVNELLLGTIQYFTNGDHSAQWPWAVADRRWIYNATGPPGARDTIVVRQSQGVSKNSTAAT